MYVWLCLVVERAVWYPGQGCSSWALLLLATGGGVRVAVCRCAATRHTLPFINVIQFNIAQ